MRFHKLNKLLALVFIHVELALIKTVTNADKFTFTAYGHNRYRLVNNRYHTPFGKSVHFHRKKPPLPSILSYVELVLHH